MQLYGGARSKSPWDKAKGVRLARDNQGDRDNSTESKALRQKRKPTEADGQDGVSEGYRHFP